MKEYNQHCFDKDYYENFARGGFKGYTWENVSKEIKMKMNWIEKVYSRFPIKSILFVACAKGFEVREARLRGYNAFGIEPSQYAIDNVDEYAKPFVQYGDIRDIPYRDNSFDLVCAFDVIHIVDIKSREKAYAELNRVAINGVVLRTRVLSAQYDYPASDGTLDGDVTLRETMSSLICKMEHYKKFKMFNIRMGQRYVMWTAFGLEQYFPTKLNDIVNRGIKNDS